MKHTILKNTLALILVLPVLYTQSLVARVLRESRVTIPADIGADCVVLANDDVDRIKSKRADRELLKENRQKAVKNQEVT